MGVLFRTVLGYTSNVGEGKLLKEKFLPALPWYVVYTRCHHEARVTQQLEAKNFNMLFPRYKTWSIRKDRRKIIELPLFPGYIFVQTEPIHKRFVDIKRTFRVAYIVGKRGSPEPINKEEMDSLLILLIAPGKVKPYPYFKESDKVVVIDGPFKGAIGYVMKVHPRNIRFEFMKQKLTERKSSSGLNM